MKKKKVVIILLSAILVIALTLLILFKFVFNSGNIKETLKNFSKLNSYSVDISFKEVASAKMSITGVTNIIDYSGKYQHYTTNNTYKTDCYYDGKTGITSNVGGNKDQYVNYFEDGKPKNSSYFSSSDHIQVCYKYYNDIIIEFIMQ